MSEEEPAGATSSSCESSEGVRRLIEAKKQGLTRIRIGIGIGIGYLDGVTYRPMRWI